ncbi:unnamed protein product [Symbiodinium sp. CCMP2592]|nr:unnamed protein product [Symbiodinium sp. CCMP2592]
MLRDRNAWYSDGAEHRTDVPTAQLNDMYQVVNQLSISQLLELAEYVARRLRNATRFMFGGVRCCIPCQQCEAANYCDPNYVVQTCAHTSHSQSSEENHIWHGRHLCWYHAD